MRRRVRTAADPVDLLTAARRMIATRLGRRRGVPPFAPVVVRDPRNVTGGGIVDGEGVVERALGPGEAVVEMVFEL